MIISPILTQAFLATAEEGVTRLLQTDSNAIIRLTLLIPKVIAIQSSTQPDYTLYITPTEQGVYLSTNTNLVADCKIIAPTFILLQLLLTTNKQNLLVNSNILIEGEKDLAFALCKILDDIHPDWYYELSQWFDPVVANTIINSLKASKEQLNMGINIVQQHMANLAGNIPFINGRNKLTDVNPIIDVLSSLQKYFRQS